MSLLMSNEGDISLTVILRFLKAYWKIIVFSGFAGIALSIIYLEATPKRYEAIAQIAMAQIGAVNNTGHNNRFNPLGINIEDPLLLISRFASPTSFTPAVVETCGYQKQSSADLALSKSIKLTIPRGISNVVELKTFGPTQQVAHNCALAIFDLIKVSQSQIVETYIKEAKIKLTDDEERLLRARDLVVKADKSGSTMNATYLSTRDEIRFLMEEITSLNTIIISSQNRVTRLVAPIYASDNPISPKKRIVFVGGLLGGLFLGLLIALVFQLLSKLRAKQAVTYDF